MSSFILQATMLGSIVDNFDEDEKNLFEEILELRLWGYTTSDICRTKNLKDMLYDDMEHFEDNLIHNLGMIDEALQDGYREEIVFRILGIAEGDDNSYTLDAKAIAHDTVLVHCSLY